MRKGSDPDTFIPEPIRKAAEAAAKKHAEIYGKTEGEEVVEATPAPEDVTPQEEVAAGEEQVLEETTTAEPVVASTETAEKDTPKSEDWEQKYKALQGKYDAEVPRLTESVKRLESLLTLQMQANAIPKATDPAPVRKEEPQIPKPPEINEESFKDMGDEMVDFIKQDKAYKKAMSERLESVIKENEKLKASVSSVHQTQAQSKEERFWGTIESAVPDFWELNGDKERGIPINPDFAAFLHESIPGFGGLTRFDALADAQRRGDSKAIIDAMTVFKERKGQTTQTPKPSLTRQIAPSRTRASSSPAVGTKPTFTKAEYNKKLDEVYVLQRKGDLSTAECDKRLAELHSALNEGRVVG